MADCMKCRGACCEDLVFPVKGLSGPTVEFMEVRCGEPVSLRGKEQGFVVPARCRHLTDEGLCGIYDERPLICAIYVAGGPACIETVKRRRPDRVKEILGYGQTESPPKSGDDPRS